jgi:hypothetical protein
MGSVAEPFVAIEALAGCFLSLDTLLIMGDE